MRALFAVTLFASASLLFLVQPMVGKMVLPYLGGSPAVWNTCMVFFQAVLLLGYLYAHKLSAVPDQRRQLFTHLGVLGLGALALLAAVVWTGDRSAVPVLASLAPTGEAVPVLNVLAMLALAVGVPFFAVSTSAPLLQKWFAATGHPSARDPYFLYAASNAGSLLVLLGYPLLVEPALRVVEQTWVFAGGFGLLVLLTALCGRAALNPLRPPSLLADSPVGTPPAPTGREKFRWLMLAFVPSSLMLGVTTHLTTDIAAIPLLWVLPLALYLLTFIAAFSRGSHRFRQPLSSLAPLVILLLVFVLTSSLPLTVGLLVAAHCGAYFVIALTLHTELAAARPHPAHLTNFYLWVSVGGVVGGAFNALLAPLMFPLPFEYGVAVVVGCFLIPRGEPTAAAATAEPDPRAARRVTVDLLVMFTMVIVCMACQVGVTLSWGDSAGVRKDVGQWVADWIGWGVGGKMIGVLLAFGPPCLLAFLFIDRPVRFGLAVAAILFVHYYLAVSAGDVKAVARTYFGVLRVGEAERELPGVEGKSKVRVLEHGTTLHGSQFVADAEVEKVYPGLSKQPLMYYHRTGPVGDLFRDALARHPDGRVATVGLGAGATAAYVGEKQSITFYEIDPKVVELVSGPTHFTYLSDARDRGAKVDTVLGDARLTLATHAGPGYHLLLLDAFSSDAIPIHLMTLEAMRLYAERITPDGLIGVHISNRYLDLAPVLAGLAKECGLACRVRTDKCEDDALKTLPGTPPGKTSSSWVVLAKSEAALAPFDEVSPATAAVVGVGLAAGPSLWEPIPLPDGMRVWTDDYADVLSVMKSPEVRWVRRQLGLPSYVR